MAATKTVAHVTTLSNSRESIRTAPLNIKPRQGVITLYGYGIAVRVESIARNEGKIELALAPASGGRTPGGTGRVK